MMEIEFNNIKWCIMPTVLAYVHATSTHRSAYILSRTYDFIRKLGKGTDEYFCTDCLIECEYVESAFHIMSALWPEICLLLWKKNRYSCQWPPAISSCVTRTFSYGTKFTLCMCLFGFEHRFNSIGTVTISFIQSEFIVMLKRLFVDRQINNERSDRKHRWPSFTVDWNF